MFYVWLPEVLLAHFHGNLDLQNGLKVVHVQSVKSRASQENKLGKTEASINFQSMGNFPSLPNGQTLL